MDKRTSKTTGKTSGQQSNMPMSSTGKTGTERDVQEQAKETAQKAANEAKEQASNAATQAKQTVREVSEQAKQKAKEATQEAKEQVTSRLDERTNEAAGRLGGVADALHRTSEELHEQDEMLMAEYAGVAADQVERFSHYLQQHNTNDLLREVRRFAERQPEIFAAGALAAGFMVGRFLKASPPRQQSQSRYTNQYGQREYSQNQYAQNPYRDNYRDNYQQYGRQYQSNRTNWEGSSTPGTYGSDPYTANRPQEEIGTSERHAETQTQSNPVRDHEAGGA